MALRVLIVDDSEDFLAAARALLEREGVSVVGVAASAEDGLRKAERERPNVVLVDIMLADESGFELARELAACENAHRPKVIMISTHAEEDFADLIGANPCIGFLAKAQISATTIAGLLPGGAS